VTEQPERPSEPGGEPDLTGDAERAGQAQHGQQAEPAGDAEQQEPGEPSESAEPDEPQPGSEEHHHTVREEIDVLRDEVRVDSYRWGQTIMAVVLVVILIGIAVAGIIWLF